MEKENNSNKKQSKKDTVIRVELKEGNFASIHREALMDKDLTDAALRLLICLLNNVEHWYINTTYFARQLGWSKDKLKSATQCLTDNGYLTRTKIFHKGKERGKNTEYRYTVREQKIPINKTDSGLNIGLQSLDSNHSTPIIGLQSTGDNDVNPDNPNIEEINPNDDDVNNIPPVEAENNDITNNNQNLKREGEVLTIDDKPVKQKDLSLINSAEITTVEQKKLIRWVAAYYFKSYADRFPSEDDWQLHAKGLLSVLEKRNFLNSQGQVIDNWAFYMKNQAEAIISGKIAGYKSQVKALRPQTSNKGTKNNYTQEEFQTLMQAVQEKLSYQFQREEIVMAGGLYNLLKPIIAEFGITDAYALCMDVFDKHETPVSRHFKEAFEKELQARSNEDSKGKKYV